MSLKTKIMNIVTAHPKLVTFGIGLAITFAVGTALGIVDNHTVAAITQMNTQDHVKP